MANSSRTLVVLSYAAAAGALAAGLTVWAPGVEPLAATGLALAAVLAAGLAHQTLRRAHRTAELSQDLRTLRRDHAELRAELGNARHELAGLLDALDAAGGTGAVRDAPATVERISGEVHILKHLFERLLEDTRDDAADAAYVAGQRRTRTHAETAPAATGAPADAPGIRGAPAERLRMLPEVKREIDDTAILETVREGLRHDRVEVVLQPVVRLPQRKHLFHECYSRVRSADGYMILPEQYIAVAERAGLVAALDNLLLFRGVQLVRKMQRRRRDLRGFFCNISLATLRDRSFVEDLIAFLQTNPELACGLIFEIGHAAARRIGAEDTRYLDRLARLGCRFSIDNVTSLDLDPAALARSRVRYVKIEAGMLLNAAQRDGRAAVERLKRDLKAHRIDLIADRVEDEDTLVELLDLGLGFGQGYLFGEPRLARP